MSFAGNGVDRSQLGSLFDGPRGASGRAAAGLDLGDHPKPAIDDHLKTGQR
jgi:hypothetical protein